MKDQIIASKSCEQPEFKTLDDASTNIQVKWGRTELYVCANGSHSTGVDLPVHMYDLLHDLLNDHRVVEHYETLRNK